MAKSSSTVKKKLEQALKSKTFKELESYQDPTKWGEMSSDERDLLAHLFIKQGERQLWDGNREALKSFQLASKAAPKNPKIFHQQALAFASHDRNTLCLRSACRALKKAVKLDPKYFDAWHVWGQVLVSLGMLTNESKLFQEANEKFKEAFPLAENISSVKLSHFYRHWGIAWYYSGKHSGEAVDFQQSIAKFEEASKLGLNHARFWNDYGNAMMELGVLLGSQEMCHQAIGYYQTSVGETPDYFSAWFNMAAAFELLYSSTMQNDYFLSGVECFEKATQLDPENAFVWLLWGNLIFHYGRFNKDLQSLSESLKKYEVADMLDPNNPNILCFWAEAQMMYGSHSEEFDQLHASEEKIQKSLELQKDNLSAWCLYGRYYVELGRYFADEKYFNDAIDKFRYGLSISEQDPFLWYGLAQACFMLGEMMNDQPLIEQSANHCLKASECGGKLFPKFWNDWGTSYLKLAEMTQEKHYLEAALEKFEHAIAMQTKEKDGSDISPEFLYNYGCALDYLGDFEADPTCYQNAIQVFMKALQNDPSYTVIHYNLGLALSHYGEITSDPDFLDKAIEQFEKMIQYDCEDEVTWNAWGLALIHLAHINQDPTSATADPAYYEQAEDKFMQAVALGNTEAFYHLACLYSLAGNFPASVHFLEKADLSGDLPTIEEIMQDEWLEHVRRTQRFQRFLSQRKQS